MIGLVFGRLRVLKLSYVHSKTYRRFWLCRCDCGALKIADGTNLRRGEIRSCGCLNRELSRKRATKHGMCKTAIYKLWYSMIRRCDSPSDDGYKNYGARGIKVSRRWLNFENFYADMGHRPDGLSLDRIDNSKGYSKGNCRWADRKTQARNRRSNTLLTIGGRRQSIVAWAEELGVSIHTVHDRLKRGWPVWAVFSKQDFSRRGCRKLSHTQLKSILSNSRFRVCPPGRSASHV